MAVNNISYPIYPLSTRTEKGYITKLIPFFFCSVYIGNLWFNYMQVFSSLSYPPIDDNAGVFYDVPAILQFVLLEQSILLDAEFKYLIIFFNLRKTDFFK